MRPSLAKIFESGAGVAIVGTGDAASAKRFQEDLDLRDVAVFTDPARRAFRLAGFRRGLLPLLRPRAVWNYIRAFCAGYRAGRLEGDALQQGGVLVMRPDGAVLFRHVSRAAGDHPAPEKILAAVRAGTPVQQASVP